MNVPHWALCALLAAFGALVWVIGAANGLAAAWGPGLAAAVMGPALCLALAIGGWLVDRHADRRREERWGRIIETKAIDQ